MNCMNILKNIIWDLVESKFRLKIIKNNNGSKTV